MTADATLDRRQPPEPQPTFRVPGRGCPVSEAFFRLWDGIHLVQSFPTGLATPNTLEMGIRLEFDPEAADGGNYSPGNFWTFPARAAGVDFDPSVWPSNAPPQGVEYHRAPLGILNWNAGPVATLTGPPQIHDCRAVFPPLTRIKVLLHLHRRRRTRRASAITSTFRTRSMHFRRPAGRSACCRARTMSMSPSTRTTCAYTAAACAAEVIADTVDPVFHVAGHSGIRIEGLFIEADENGVGILVETDLQGVVPARILLADLGLQRPPATARSRCWARDGSGCCACIVTMADLPQRLACALPALWRTAWSSTTWWSSHRRHPPPVSPDCLR